MPMTKKRNINMFLPHVTPNVSDRVAEILKTPMIGQGQEVDKFEAAIKKALNLSYLVAVNTSSAAIKLALDICGVGPGDEVLTTPMTCTLTNHPILEQFAKPIFSDIQADTGNMDPDDVKRRITAKTKAIICTHWGGTPCDLDELNVIARQHNIPVIEDASEAFGAQYHGRSIGLNSRFVAFSFQAIQLITASEGGALAMQMAADYGLAKIKRWYGIDREGRKANILGYYNFDISMVGYGYHMTNVAAAIGLENLNSLSKQKEHRNKMAAIYWKQLANVPGVTLLKQHNDREPSYHFYTILVENRNDFCLKLNDAGIHPSIVHARNDEYSVFGGIRNDLPILDYFSKRYIGLPLHMGTGEEDVNYIVEEIKAGW